MVGGVVLENRIMLLPESNRMVRRLWCIDTDSHGECAVYADPDEAKDVMPKDFIWWQSGKIFWSDTAGTVSDKEIDKIGYSFDPR